MTDYWHPYGGYGIGDGPGCQFWGNLGLDSVERGPLWPVVIIVQLAFIVVYAGIYFTCFRNSKTLMKWHFAVLYFNSSFWWWAIWLLYWGTVCSMDLAK